MIGSLDIFPGASGININSLSGYPLTAANGGTGSTYLAPGGVLIGNGTGPITSEQLTTGQLLFGNGAAGTTPVPGMVVGMGGIGVAYDSMTATLTISGGSSSTFAWNTAAGTVLATPNTGYICTSTLTLTLPAVISVGDVIRVTGGTGSMMWTIDANAGQTIQLGSQASSSGGSLASTNPYDTVELLCVTANTAFVVLSSMGNVTVF